MFLPIFVAFGLLLNLPQSLENQDLVLRDIIIDDHVIGVLGEEVHLHCLYSGKLNISYSSWKHQESGTRSKTIAGYKNGKPFARDNFYTPASTTNLTVKVSINSFMVEGQYRCIFGTDEEVETVESLKLTIIARPEVNTHVKEEILNGTHYQSIFCSASHAKPSASLHWDIHGAPPSEDIFSIINTNSTLPNGTGSIISMLRFPIHLNNESSVACVIQHPALTEPITTVIQLQTFVSPNATIEVALIEREGKAFFEVLCRAKGGRPHPSIIWIPPESSGTSCSPHLMKFESVSSFHCFPLDAYEGENITCIFGYPHLSNIQRTVTLPTFHLTSLQLTNNSIKVNHLNTSDLLILEEEDSDIRINMEVLGNVPRYQINCTKDGELLSEDMNVVVSGLMIKGPIGANHAGQYQCQASYYRHKASLQFEIEVKPRVRVLAPIHVTLFSNTSWENRIEYTEVKCMADNVSPDANITWVTRDCRSGISDSDPGKVVSGSLQENGVVWNTARLPVYSYAGCTVICVVHHRGLEKLVQKSIQIPSIASIHVTLFSNTSWENGIEYTEVKCMADNVSPDANITWVTRDCRSGISDSDPGNVVPGSHQDHGVVWKTARLPVYSYAGCTVICVVHHHGLEKLVQKSIHIPSIGPPKNHVSFDLRKGSTHWAAVCEYKSDGAITNSSCVISDTNAIPLAMNTTKEGSKVLVTCIYKFELFQHEGKFLTCIIQNDRGDTERRTIHVPNFFISSIVVLNKTVPLHGSHGQHTGVHRVALEEHVPNQRIIFRVNGNASASNIKCFRSNGLFAHTVGMALVFAQQVSESDAGLYTCSASWYHHNATVTVLVEVTSQKMNSMMLILVCFSSALAITFILVVALCIFCKRNEETHSSTPDWTKRESLAALMQDPRSPELKKPRGQGQEYAELVHYSIVIDVKSTV
ncbi:uncharacterized protein si:ch211-149e23.4 isoform X1 [Ictalurus punctatus]|uniref:Uncharacterized protein si:ch211-149e23.4 isoform X1 n=1 Tax=Ictalurus punctatus TaxID=7998 RepID=A0A2D0SW80_ICTPU|nr:uncharacterized protein si:ch211-149e23.4 isoform X1 [Ictalurus punctatus]